MLWLKGMIGLYTFRSSLKNLLCTDHRPTRWGGILIGWVPIVYGQRSALTSIDARHRRYGVKDAASSDRHPIYDRTSYASQPCWLFSLQQLNRKSLGISIIMLGVLLFLLSRQEYNLWQRWCHYFFLSMDSYSMSRSTGIIKIFSSYAQLSVSQIQTRL